MRQVNAAVPFPAIRRGVALVACLATVAVWAQNDTLKSAAQAGDVSRIKAALEAGTPIDVQDDEGATALFYAAQGGHLAAVEFLTRTGANVNTSGPFTVVGQTFRVSALAAAAIGEYADVVRVLLKHGAPMPELLTLHHQLVPYTPAEYEIQRDWEINSSIIRRPEVHPVMRAIVARHAEGTYRTHDGLEYQVREENSLVRLTSPNGSVAVFESVDGKAYIQRIPAGVGAPPVRPRTKTDVTMIERFLRVMPEGRRKELTEQFVQRGGMWLDFNIADQRVLGFQVRTGGPGRFAGNVLVFNKVGVRPDAPSRLEWETESAAAVPAPMNWPSFRGSNALGIGDGQFPPTTWDALNGINIRWKTPIPGLGHSSPVVWGNRIFVTTAVSSNSQPEEFRPGPLRSVDRADLRHPYIWKLYCSQ